MIFSVIIEFSQFAQILLKVVVGDIKLPDLKLITTIKRFVIF